MSSPCRHAVVVVAIVLATLLRNSAFTSAAPQTSVVFRDSQACNCILLDHCSSLLPQPGQRLTREQVAVLRSARCGFQGRSIKVCCPGDVSPKPPPATVAELPRTCGFSSAFDKIYGGNDAPLGAYPWMVALGYKGVTVGESGTSLFFQCGGSLVTSRHVITAAHCVHPGQLRGQQLLQLNVGDWNLATDPDCQSAGISTVCVSPVVVRRPADIKWHPDYNSDRKHNNDIAVVTLDDPVTFGAFVQPICIPEAFDPRFPDPANHPRAVATGWGFQANGETATILQEVRLPFVDINVCNASWLGQLSPGQLCAGGEAGKDTCGGDSGGPLITTGKHGPPFKLVGLTSFGSSSCGNKDNYGVYTAVAGYYDWLVDTMTA